MRINGFFKSTLQSSGKLAAKSAEALSTFNKVMDDLKQINEESNSRQKELKDEAWEIQREITELETVNIANLKIISNIEKILK